MMVDEIKFTLIADGASDRALINIIKWLLDDLYPEIPNKINFADFKYLKKPPSKKDIPAQIAKAREYYPFDILIYHRDAETNNLKTIKSRKLEVFKHLSGNVDLNNVVCVIPVRMMESWLLIDEEAIKKAAGNRSYSGELNIPPIKNIENETKPKELLHKLLKDASGNTGRRLKKFDSHKAVHLVAENIKDFSDLRFLEAFQIFEQDLKNILKTKLNF